MYKKLFTLFLFLFSLQLLTAQTSSLKNFPEGYTPDEIGRRIAYRFVTEKHALHAGKWIGYPETFYWNGSLKYAAPARDLAPHQEPRRPEHVRKPAAGALLGDR